MGARQTLDLLGPIHSSETNGSVCTGNFGKSNLQIRLSFGHGSLVGTFHDYSGLAVFVLVCGFCDSPAPSCFSSPGPPPKKAHY